MLSEATKTVTAAVSIVLAVASGDPSGTDKTAGGSEAAEAHPSAKVDKYKRNPNPKQRYEITMIIADAPGSFVIADAFAQYKASDCWYTLNKLEGVLANPEISLPMTYTRISDTTYSGMVYLDAMTDASEPRK